MDTGATSGQRLVSVCFMDISAGFHTVPHIYLLRKLEMFGFEDSALAWVDNYLSGRTQAIQATQISGKLLKGYQKEGPVHRASLGTTQ